MKRITKSVGIAVTCAVAAIAMQGAAFADFGLNPKSNARHSRIVGLWDVEVSIASCLGGPSFASFLAMHKFEIGGTGQVVPATDPTGLSEHSMIWDHVRGNDYRMAVKMFRFDADQMNIGWVIIRNEVTISEDASEYVGTGVAEFFDANGNFQFSTCPSFIGTRFTG